MVARRDLFKQHRFSPGFLSFVEDAADVDVKSFVAMQEAEEAKRRQMSQAYQRGLPIPREVNRDILRTSTAQNEEQMVSLRWHTPVNHGATLPAPVCCAWTARGLRPTSYGRLTLFFSGSV